MRPPSDEDIENYDDIMWSFIDVLQALLDWRKIIDLQFHGETLFRVTMSFPELLGPSSERDIQLVSSWDELPPLPEKHPPGYWRKVWEAQQAAQQAPAEEAPEPADRPWWAPPPDAASRRPYPQAGEVVLRPPPPLCGPLGADLLRTADAMRQSMDAIGKDTASPWHGWQSMAAPLDVMDQMYRQAPAKAAARVQAAASDCVSMASDATPASPPPPAPAAPSIAAEPGQVPAIPGDDKNALAGAVIDTVTDPHIVLTAAGFLPGLAGTVATLADAVVEIREGHDTDALIDLVAAAAGVVSDAGLVKAGLTIAKEALTGERLAAETVKTAKAAEETAEAAKLKAAAKPHEASKAEPAPPPEAPHQPPPAEPPRDEAPPEPEHTENSLEQNKKVPDIRTSVLKILRRRGMKSRVVTDIHGREVPIYGQAKGSSKTDGHAEAMIEEAERMARSGEYEYITLQRSLRTATGRESESRRMPDIIGVKRNGRVEQVEVQSDSDESKELEQRMEESNLTLPEQRRMQGRIIQSKPAANKD